MRKKIAIVSPGFMPVPAIKGGGIENLLTILIEDNEERNIFDFDVYSIEDPGLKEVRFQNSRIIQVRIRTIEKQTARIFNKICRILHIKIYLCPYGYKCGKLIHRTQYDYIIIENNVFAYEKIYKMNPNSRFIFHVHNDIGGKDKPVNLCKMIAQTACSVWGCSRYLTKRFKKSTGANNVSTLCNTVNLTTYEYSADARKAMRKKFDIKKDDTLFVYVGRISPEKGVLELIHAFKSLANSARNTAQLLICGDVSNGSPYTQTILREIRTDLKIKSTGYLEDSMVADIMSASDCVVIPTICQEAFGLVAVEAMACGKAIITSGTGGLGDLVSHDMAIIVPLGPNFEQKLRRALGKLVANHKLCQEMGRLGNNRIMNMKEIKSEEYLTNLEALLNKLD